MLLENKTAIIYGAGGLIGGAVARGFAREGARVYLAGRTLAKLDAVAKEITAAGGRAATARVDALDERDVDQHADAVAKEAGGIDVTFNAVSWGGVQWVPHVNLSCEQLIAPLVTATTTLFLTARTAAARHMIRKGSGVILTLTPGSTPAPRMGAKNLAAAAVETLTRNLATELGPHGVRVVGLQLAGTQESFRSWPKDFRTKVFDDPEDTGPGMTRDEFEAAANSKALLRRASTLAEFVNVATFVASDRASAMTGTVANVTGGAIID